jgi:hypothetical protein
MREPSHSKPIPGTIGVMFGGLWALIAVMASPPGWRIPLAAIAMCATMIFIARAWRGRRALPSAAQRLFGRKTYQIAVVGEVIAIYAASALLPGFGWQGYFIQVVGIIVGLHFIGLWKASGSLRFLGIATAMCVVSVITVALPANVHLFHLRDFFTGAGNALVLWLGASGSPNGNALSATINTEV